MKSIRLVVMVLLTLGTASVMNAQATRTWVSGVGDDVNPCSRTAPCKTFAGAISKTAVRGEINVVDPGGFGTVTITKSITIDGTPFLAGVLNAGVPGITINITAGGDPGIVILRHLDINGAGSGINGINILAANQVIIEDCKIYNNVALSPSGNGIRINAMAVVQVVVRDCTISNNSNDGINATTSGVIGKLQLENTRVVLNGENGVELNDHMQATFARSDLADNGAAGVLVSLATSSVDAYNTIFDGNGSGLTMNGGSSAKIFACQVVHNTTSMIGSVTTHGNNSVVDNQINTLPTPNINTQ